MKPCIAIALAGLIILVAVPTVTPAFASGTHAQSSDDRSHRAGSTKKRKQCRKRRRQTAKAGMAQLGRKTRCKRGKCPRWAEPIGRDSPLAGPESEKKRPGESKHSDKGGKGSSNGKPPEGSAATAPPSARPKSDPPTASPTTPTPSPPVPAPAPPAAPVTPAPTPPSDEHNTPPPSSPVRSGRCSLAARPMSVDSYTHILPLGNLSPSGGHVFPTDHLYFMIAGGPAIKPTYAVGSMKLVKINGTENLSTSVIEHKLDFECGTTDLYYGHMGALSERLTAARNHAAPRDCSTYTTGGSTYRRCTYDVAVDVQSGEQLGSTSGLAAALDLGTFDQYGPILPFINQSTSFYGTSHLYATCPLDSFSQPLKGELESQLGDSVTTRTATPVCGEVMQDIATTAQGNWFLASQPPTLQEDKNLALVHDNVEPTKPVFSIGSSVKGLSSATYSYTASNSGLVNRDFAQIRADGSTYCFESLRPRFSEPIGGTLLVAMPTGTDLRIEYRASQTSCGAGPWSFSGDAVDFVR